MEQQYKPSRPDPLALSSTWGQSSGDQINVAPLLSLEAVLETSWLRRGISREKFLAELLTDLDHRRILPLLAMLPKGWRVGSASLPEHLRSLGALLEGGLVSPLLIAALADDLHHLYSAQDVNSGATQNTLERWEATTIRTGKGTEHQPLPQTLAAWHEQGKQTWEEKPANRPRKGLQHLGAGLIWQNLGLSHQQSASSRWSNRLLAQIFNALGANHLAQGKLAHPPRNEPFRFEGVSTTSELVRLLSASDWNCRARVRASVASFGLGASCPNSNENGRPWLQIPLALPYRTGILHSGEEISALLPHCSLELELTPPDGSPPNLLQFYQGSEGFNGWAAMNDLHRPWQNDRNNGTVAYPGLPIEAIQLETALEICDLMAVVHNTAAVQCQLCSGGYGALGFCIDSTALLEQALTGRCHLFPLTLGGVWRERLSQQLDKLLSQGMRPKDPTVVERYCQALETLPSDLNLHGRACSSALERLRESQPLHSPFKLVRRLNGENNTSPWLKQAE